MPRHVNVFLIMFLKHTHLQIKKHVFYYYCRTRGF